MPSEAFQPCCSAKCLLRRSSLRLRRPDDGHHGRTANGQWGHGSTQIPTDQAKGRTSVFICVHRRFPPSFPTATNELATDGRRYTQIRPVGCTSLFICVHRRFPPLFVVLPPDSRRASVVSPSWQVWIPVRRARRAVVVAVAFRCTRRGLPYCTRFLRKRCPNRALVSRREVTPPFRNWPPARAARA